VSPGSHRSDSFLSGRGDTLHTLAWSPAGDPRGLVVLSHGYGEHAGRYQELAAALVGCGFAVRAIDHAGHGRSAGRRGHVESFEGLVSDLGAFVKSVRGERPELSCGLFGHSVGGAVAAALCAREPFAVDALALSAPYLGHADQVPDWRLRLVRLLDRVVPNLGVDKIDPALLSRLPAEVAAYRSDPLVFHGKVSAHTVLELFSGFETVARAKLITVPLLVIQGSEDRIADPAASRTLTERVSSTDVTFELVDGGFHEVLNDLGRERVLERILDWLQPRLTAG
jgi:alpha-beta hydrolase superfamily lysophospholipase